MAIQRFRGDGSRRVATRAFLLSFLVIVVSSAIPSPHGRSWRFPATPLSAQTAFAAGEAEANVGQPRPAAFPPPATARPAKAGRLEKYVREMPPASRVLSDIQGKDPLDTSARQLGALTKLLRMMALMTGPGSPSPREKAVWDSYKAAMGPIYKSTIDGFDPNEGKWLFWRRGKNSTRAKWIYQTDTYERDGNLEMELLKRYFSAEWQNKYLEMKGLDRKLLDMAEAQNAKEGKMAAMGRSENRLSRMFDSGMVGGILMAYAGVFIAAFLYSIKGSVGLDTSDPRKLNLGKWHYELQSATGTVLSPSTDREVHTHVSGGGGYGQISGGSGYVHTAPITSTTTTTTHLQFFLKENDGNERPIQITDVDLAVRDGHEMSVVWASRDDLGDYFLFRNHSTKKTAYNDKLLGDMLRPIGFFWPTLVLSLPLLGIPFFIFIKAQNIVTGRRIRRAKQLITERLIPQLDKV